MDHKSKFFPIIAVCLLVVSLLYFYMTNYFSHNTSAQSYGVCNLLIKDIKVVLNNNKWHVIILNLTTTTKWILITNIRYSIESSSSYIAQIEPTPPINVTYSNYTIVKIILHDEKLVDAVPHEYESPMSKIRFLERMIEYRAIYTNLTIYYKCSNNYIMYDKIDLLPYIKRFIIKKYGTPYDFAVADVYDEGGEIEGFSYVKNVIVIKLKSYSNYTLHISKIQAFIYDKKTNNIVLRQTLKVNITLLPYEKIEFRVIIKTPIRLWKYYLKIYVYSKEGVVRVGKTTL